MRGKNLFKQRLSLRRKRSEGHFSAIGLPDWLCQTKEQRIDNKEQYIAIRKAT
jgi:hypothetical protein